MNEEGTRQRSNNLAMLSLILSTKTHSCINNLRWCRCEKHKRRFCCFSGKRHKEEFFPQCFQKEQILLSVVHICIIVSIIRRQRKGMILKATWFYIHVHVVTPGYFTDMGRQDLRYLCK